MRHFAKQAMRALLAILAVIPVLLGGASAFAQIYRWTDERGVVNYSNQPPMKPEIASGLAVVEDRVSVYTPDAALLQAIEAERRGGGVSRRIAELERQLEAERRARQLAAAVAAASRPSDPCLTGSLDCSSIRGPYYTPVYLAARPIVRPRPTRPAQPVPPPPALLQNVPGSRPWLGIVSPSRPWPSLGR